MHADNFRNFEVDGLSEHSRFGLNSADAPADYAETVNHCGMGVRADKRVGIENAVVFAFGFKNQSRQIFQIDLVYDSRRRRNDGKCLKCLLPPFEEFVAFLVSFKFLFEIFFKGVGSSGAVHLHRVVDDQIHGHERLDNGGIFSLFRGGVAHCGEIDKKRNARKVLQNYARHHKRHFVIFGRCGVPCGELFYVGFGCADAVAISQHAFQHYLYAHGQARHVEARLFKRFETVYITFRAAFF